MSITNHRKADAKKQVHTHRPIVGDAVFRVSFYRFTYYLDISQYDSSVKTWAAILGHMTPDDTVDLAPMELAVFVSYLHTPPKDLSNSCIAPEQRKARANGIEACWKVININNDPECRAGALDVLWRLTSWQEGTQ